MRHRVVHVVVAGEIGGAERMLAELASRPDESGADHTIALFTPDAKLRDFFSSYGIKIIARNRVRESIGTTLRHAFGHEDLNWLCAVLKSEQATIVQLHTFGSQVLGARAAIKQRLPFVRTEHSTRVYRDISCIPFSRWSLARAAAVVAVGDYIAGVVRPHLRHNQRMFVVRNGVDTNRFSPVASNASDRPFRFLLAGRLEHRKGVDIALRAVAQAPTITLDIAGDGEDRAKLEQLAKRLGVSDRVRFLGYLIDVRVAIGNVDAMLSSSRTEGLPVGLIEAMACERPVLAPPVGGIPEVVINDQTGWLTDNLSVEAIATKMQQVAANREECRELGKSARQWAVANASIEAMRAGYGAVYDFAKAQKLGK